MIGAEIFRSLSLVEDLDQPERFAHYRPTRRALPIISAVASPGGATMVIAPYGSGKSLAAGVGALLVRAGAGDQLVLGQILERFVAVDPESARAFRERLAEPASGHVIILSGLVDDPLAAIAAALSMAHVPKSADGFGKAMKEGGWDHVAIIWDEFGRHLEGLVADGRASELDIIQRLAERSSRASGPTMSLTLLLHQNLLAYATRLNETSRSEWRKIEGRFRALRMIEDSQEFYRLIADVVKDMRPHDIDAILPLTGDAIPPRVVASKWLDGIESPEAVRAILDDARPLTAGALQILPTLVARVGQNERSLFSFLREADLTQKVDIEAVYGAFSDAMRTDVGIGGTYRRWVETESARSRADGALQRTLLAAACLLQLGSGGERLRLPRDLLELSVADGAVAQAEVSAAIDALITAKLLLWRQHTDDIAVWHGADIDVAIRVREERERRSGLFDLKPFLAERFPAPHVRATRHNAEYGVNRFLSGTYASLCDLRALLADPAAAQGRILYVLAEDKGEIATAKALAKASNAKAIIVIPERPLAAESAAIELVSIEALRADKEFLDSDPMVVTEIDELQSVAFDELARLLRGLLDPSGGAASWYAEGARLSVGPERPGPMAASRLLSQWYSRTPRIANDQMMRDKASRTMQTARVRVVGAILERGERPRLGYEEGDRSAEGSIYRTVLEHSGLRPAGATRFVDPDQIEDPGLREVWTQIAEFFRLPSGGARKDLAALVATLASPPMGVPLAVIPLIVAAGFKHFARAVALYRDDIYVTDTLGFPFDMMVANPEGYTVEVLDATAEVKDYLGEVAYVFAHEHPPADGERVRFAYDALNSWLLTVPDGSRRSQKLSGEARALLRLLGASSDPVDLLFTAIPSAMGHAKEPLASIAALERTRNEIDHLRDEFAQEAVVVIADSFSAGPGSTDPLAAITAWANCFNSAALDRRSDLRIVDKAVLRKSLEAINGRFSPKSLANSLSSILLQRSLDKWDDRTAAQFRFALRDARERIESAALDTDSPDPALRPVVEARLKELTAMLGKIDAASKGPDLKIAGGKS